ncbi:MAG: hypothetical protein EHM83_08440, partial [Burkholderiales bacterium]
DVTVPALFGRAINLYWDGRHLPQVLALAASDAPWWRIAVVATGALALVWAIHRCAAWALAALQRGLALRPVRRAAVAASLLAIALFAASRVTPPMVDPGLFARPVTATFAQQAAFVATALSPTSVRKALPPGPAFESNLGNLRSADLMLVFVESYGATTLDEPRHARALADRRAALARALATSGRSVVSARVRSPTFGGASWLAHASLLSGIDMHDPGRYDLLLTTDRPTLVGLFREHGYDTVALMPGLRSPWPEGRFYGFTTLYDSRALDYRGPEFGFWRIPDQFALARLDALELAAPARAPRFVFFPTITSHIPFRPVPPYAADWQALLGTHPFDAGQVERTLAQPADWHDLVPGYLESVAYTFDWLTGYLSQAVDRDTVMIVVGDHQPVAGVSGRDATWDVPVHVIASRTALLGRFEAAGFCPGLEPRGAAIGAMHELTEVLLAAFDDAAPRAAYRRVSACAQPGSAAGADDSA